jgi:hypothetical protein
VASVINRYYDPTTDEFLNIDPKVAESNQPYVFTNDNPLNATDPLGLLGATGLTFKPCQRNCGPSIISVVASAAKKVSVVAKATIDILSAAPGHRAVSKAAGFVGGLLTIAADKNKGNLYTLADLVGGTLGGIGGAAGGVIVGGSVGAYNDTIACGGDPVCAPFGVIVGGVVGGVTGSILGAKWVISFIPSRKKAGRK